MVCNLGYVLLGVRNVEALQRYRNLVMYALPPESGHARVDHVPYQRVGEPEARSFASENILLDKIIQSIEQFMLAPAAYRQ